MARIEAFGDLPLGQRRELARLADEVTAESGETLMRQGDQGLEFLMLEEGSADVIMDGERINVVGAGDFFGELAILDDGVPRTASVVATSDICAISLTAHFMREVRERMPAVGEQIDRVAAQRIERDRRAAS
ncbi:MAG: cyclic nucleotide-binding domain-containing protein [Solirubrobacteraceae bacterium]